ncbi:MAG: GIY-YIG nuclease family protein [Anaerolineales bacterium]|nr:GIY-YIG nuclease family protein [Anaerolineales bacterium]
MGSVKTEKGQGDQILKARSYFVYILSNRSRTLYVGATNDLERRIYEHKHNLVPGFTSRYRIDRLVYFEETGDVQAPIAREKQLKGWLRAKKVALIESVNSTWEDLSAE